MVDRDRVYELNGDDSRTLAAVGTFRVVPEQEREIYAGTVQHLRDEALVETVDLGDDGRGLTLTEAGRDLLDSHTLERDGEATQTFYAGVSRPRDIDHDSKLYATYRQEEARLRDEHGNLEISRVILEQDSKREYQEFLQEHNRNRSDSDGRPDRSEDEIPRRRRPFLNPTVQHAGDLAVLSFNLLSYRTDEGLERLVSKWNSTEGYRRTEAGWRIAHSHWSFIKPELKDDAMTEVA